MRLAEIELAPLAAPWYSTYFPWKNVAIYISSVDHHSMMRWSMIKKNDIIKIRLASTNKYELDNRYKKIHPLLLLKKRRRGQQRRSIFLTDIPYIFVIVPYQTSELAWVYFYSILKAVLVPIGELGLLLPFDRLERRTRRRYIITTT